MVNNNLLEKLYSISSKYILQSERSGKKVEGVLRRGNRYSTGPEVRRFILNPNDTNMLCDLRQVLSPLWARSVSSRKISWRNWLS